MDVLFVTPSYKPYASQESIGSLILAKKVKDAGYTTRILRFWEALPTFDYETFRTTLLNLIIKINASIVSFYCRAEEYHIILDLSMRIKEQRPKTYIVLGGPQAELTAEKTLQQYSSIDYVCCGEGENTIVPLLKYLINNSLDRADAIAGLVYRNKNGQITKNTSPKLLPDEYCRGYNYYDMISSDVIHRSKYLTIDVGRGCPFACTFCSTKTFWKQKYRLRNLDDIIDEIKYVKANFGDKIYSFTHDLFTSDKHRVLEFCKKLKLLNFDIEWTCSSRIDCVDKNLIDKMISVGLKSIYYGIETGSESMQHRINKKLKIAECIDTVSYSIKKGLNVTTSFIVGFPDETDYELEDTLRLIHRFVKLGADVQLHSLQFESGTKIFDEFKNSLKLDSEHLRKSFGAVEMTSYIERDCDNFSIFWNYPSRLRKETKLLETFHSILKVFPIAYTTLFDFFITNEFKYCFFYKLFISLVEDSINKFELTNINISRSISAFVYIKLLSKLKNSDILSKLQLTKKDIMLISNKIYNLLNYKIP